MEIRKLNTPKWLIFIIDVAISLSSIIIAYYLRFNFDIPASEFEALQFVLPIVLVIRATTLYFSKLHEGILRFTGTSDFIKVGMTVLFGSSLFVITNSITYLFYGAIFIIPFSIIIIDFLSTSFFLMSYRFIVKMAHTSNRLSETEHHNILIFGAGESGIISKRTMDRDGQNLYKIIGFLDDNEKKKGRKLEGKPVYHTDQLEELLEEYDIDHLIVSIQNLSAKRLNEITEVCLKYNTKVLNVPPVSKWINGELSFKQIRGIKIEDLLGREPIKLDKDIIAKKLNNKRILITGAAGSIGSGLVEQILRFNPGQLVLFDQAETPLYELENSLLDKGKLKNAEIVVGDIRNVSRLRKVFENYKPQVVFHAAAYKHVPLMELNPSEAVLTNVLGSKNLADLSNEFEVETFVMISTDKAVNPTNVMGTSKRIAEMYTQGLNAKSKTNFITTRLEMYLAQTALLFLSSRNK